MGLLRMSLAGKLATAVLVLGLAPGVNAKDYVDPRLLDVPPGNYSFIRQGWRGYLETLPAEHFRNGLGIVWNRTPPAQTPEQTAANLAWAGFARVRLEVPWGSVRWDERGFDEETTQRLSRILKALQANGLRPLVLLNANHLQPCPVRWQTVRVLQAAESGARHVEITGDLGGFSAGIPTLMSLADGTHAGPLVDDFHRDPRVAGAYILGLSKSLSRRLPVNEELRVAVLRYPPLNPVGSPEFEHTAGGWLRYVSLVTQLLDSTFGRSGYDVEIWNELTFGSAFLDIANYRDGSNQPPPPEFLHRGGAAWELARRTTDLLKAAHPEVQVIWGFSNTTFFHVAVEDLPPRVDGQSYHPYGTARRCYADLVRGRRALLLDDFVPAGCVIQPEGYAHAWQQTESLLRLIAPAVRDHHPPGETHFVHFITEHGLAPREIGIEDPREAERAKAAFALRAPLLWLNKGLSAIYLYSLYDDDPAGFGLLGAGGARSETLQILHRLTAEFSGTLAPQDRRPLDFAVAREGGTTGILQGDPSGRYLAQEDAVALLPFQRDRHRFLVAAYVMTQDFPVALSPQPYLLTIKGVEASAARVRCYLPADDQTESCPTERRDGAIRVRVSLTDQPRLIELDDGHDEPDAGTT
ncbi:MAG TPA: hypothetical protein VL994_04805 [Steroidobacteraceae bacterium]|nr:hypothetical protein [Steroidobacteraceae bacterium]